MVVGRGEGRRRTIILSLSTAAFVVFGLDRIGATPIAPGHDVGFNWGTRSAGQELILTSDAGDLKCWVRLKVRAHGAKGYSFRAKLSNGRELGVTPKGSDNSAWWLEVSESNGGSGPVKFEWPSGVSIIVYSGGGSPPGLALEDWYLYLKDKESDSLSKATWRGQWFWISLLLLGLSIFGTIYGALVPKTARQPLTPQMYIAELIMHIEGSNREETRRMRLVLRKVVLEGAKVNEVVDTLHLQPVERKKLWFKARSYFLHRLRYLIENLETYRRSLVS